MTRWQECTDDKEKYNLYLCSREWAEKREAVRERCYGMCERCKLRRMHAVHHLTYARKYAEHLPDLQAVCFECHEFIHGKIDDDPRIDLNAEPFDREWQRRFLATMQHSVGFRAAIKDLLDTFS